MYSPYLPVFITEDYEAWEFFKDTPYRWAFNKLEVALRQGLHAGPAATSPDVEGSYISRPIYNLYGMGIEAKKFEFTKSMTREMINYSVVPPGSFWCEWLDGDHYSIDYRRFNASRRWDTASVWQGHHYSHENLTKFEEWVRVNPEVAPSIVDLPLITPWASDPYVNGFNVEIRGGFVTEVHLRLGNAVFEDLPVGTKVIPVWDDEEIGDYEFRENALGEMTKYKAFGRISNVRQGFKIIRY